jgi:hypothetical protein
VEVRIEDFDPKTQQSDSGIWVIKYDGPVRNMKLIKVFEESLTGFLQLMFRSSISFWSDPKADGVTYLITSAFGLLIVSLARYQNYQETDLSELITAALPMLIVSRKLLLSQIPWGETN